MSAITCSTWPATGLRPPTLVTPDQGQHLVVLTPADADTRERLELLRVLGIEEFPTGATGTTAP